MKRSTDREEETGETLKRRTRNRELLNAYLKELHEEMERKASTMATDGSVTMAGIDKAIEGGTVIGTDEEGESISEKAILSGVKPDCWQLIRMALELAGDPDIMHCSNILLIGPPGCGKSYAALHQSLRPGQRVHNATLTEDMPSVELRGHQIIDGNSTVYIDLMAAQAMKNGDRLVLNEISKGGPDMHSFLLGVLDNVDSSFMEIPKLIEAEDGSKVCEVIRPKRGFHVVATTNDPANRLQPALRDRFPIIIVCDTVAPDALKRIHKDLQSVASRYVMHKDKNKRIGMRKWLAFDELIQKVGYEDAYLLIFGKTAAFGDELNSALKILKGTPGDKKEVDGKKA